MPSQLILVEGLPGSGKSTTAHLTYDFLKSKRIPVEVYEEGNLNHPADFDGVAYFTEGKFDQLLHDFSGFQEVLKQHAQIKGKDIFIPYQKLKSEQGAYFSEALLDKFYKHDVYELPLDEHIRLMTENWQRFASQAKKGNTTYIFECCYLQNPVTTSFIKYNAPYAVSKDFVQALTDAVKPLNPVLIYVDQNNIDFTFRKALKERSKEWADFFIHYYTNQGYGLASQLEGVEGTIEVLEARAQLEKEIINEIDIQKIILDNSVYEHALHQEKLNKFLKCLIE